MNVVALLFIIIFSFRQNTLQKTHAVGINSGWASYIRHLKKYCQEYNILRFNTLINNSQLQILHPKMYNKGRSRMFMIISYIHLYKLASWAYWENVQLDLIYSDNKAAAKFILILFISKTQFPTALNNKQNHLHT